MFFVFEDLSKILKEINKIRLTGVSLRTYQVERLIPESKSIKWLNSRIKIKKEFLPLVDEGLIVNQENQILEGLSSNFFYIKDGIVFSADKDVLNGVTRQILNENMTIEAGFLNVNEIEIIDEAFITSTSRGVLPVKTINGIAINPNSLGVQCIKISHHYEKCVKNYLEILEY